MSISVQWPSNGTCKKAPSKLRREVNIREAIGSCKQRCNVFFSPSGDSASDTVHEESQVRMAVGEHDEFINFAGNGSKRASHSRDGITSSLEATSLAIDGTELFKGNPGSASVMVSHIIAAEHKNLALLEALNPIGGHPGKRLLLGKEIFFKVDGLAIQFLPADLLVVLSAAGPHLVPHHSRALDRSLEIHRAANTKAACSLLGILIRTDVSKDPALCGQRFHQFLDHLCRIDMRTVLKSISNHGNKNVVALFGKYNRLSY